MNKLSRFAVLGLAAIVLSGCVVSVGNSRGTDREASWQQAERENREAIASLEQGLTVGEIRYRMGTPDFLESVTVDGLAYQVLFYRTHRVRADGMTTRDETTPLVFEEGRLVGWGEVAWFNLTGIPLADY